MTRQRLFMCLALAFVAAQSGVRLLVVPTWEHFDENTHYEYMRYLVEHGRPPDKDSRDDSILGRAGFKICQNERSSTCVWSGTQFEEKPGYYWLQAVPQWLVRPAAVDAQVFLARLVSTILALCVAALSWWAAQEFQPGNIVLAVLSTSLLGLVMTYADLMTALNNDVSAIAAVSLVCAAGVSIVRHGLNAGRGVLLAAGMMCCIFSKTSAYIGLPLAALALVLGVWPSLPRWLRWSAPVLIVAGIALTFDFHLPAEWQIDGTSMAFSRTPQTAADRKWAFYLKKSADQDALFWQALSPEALSAVKGQKVTVGAWVRTDASKSEIPLPQLTSARQPVASARVHATGIWTFYAYHAEVPSEINTLEIQLVGRNSEVVEYDGVVLAVGEWPLDVVPTFDDSTGQIMVWGENRLINWVRNGSAESGWLMARTPLNRLLPWGGVNYRLQSYYDWPRTWHFYKDAITWQFVTFWASFGNGIPALPVLGLLPYVVFTALSGLGLFKTLLQARQQHRWAGWQWRLFIFFAAVIGLALSMSLLRIDPVRADGTVFYMPTARHFYVAIVPTVLLLADGWLALWPQRLKRPAAAALLLIFYALGVWSLFQVQLPYFHAL